MKLSRFFVVVIALAVIGCGNDASVNKNKEKREATWHMLKNVTMAFQEYQDKFACYPYTGDLQADYDNASKESGKPVKLEFEPAALYKMIKDYGKFVSGDTDKNDKGEEVITDAWGYPIRAFLVITRLERKNSSGGLALASKIRFAVEILSVGEDGKLGTADDVLLLIEK